MKKCLFGPVVSLFQIYDTVLAPVGPPLGGHLTDWTHQIYDTVLAPVSPPLGGHLTHWGLNSPDLWHSPCPSQPSIGRPPYRLRIELTRSMTQSLPQSALHWAATLQTEDWTHQIYDTVLAPVGPPLAGHLTDWGLNSPDLWHSPCPSRPSIGRPPYRRAWRPPGRRRSRGRWARWRHAPRRYSTGRNTPYAGPSWSRSVRGRETTVKQQLRYDLVLGSVYTKRQCQHSDDPCDSVLIENSGVPWKWVANSFWSDSIVFNENRIVSLITALTLTLGVNGHLHGGFHKMHENLVTKKYFVFLVMSGIVPV